MSSERPNIIFFHVDNLGMGELGCYGGGILRGADTKRIDQFATEGLSCRTMSSNRNARRPVRP